MDDYTVAHAETLKGIDKEVEKLLKEGFRPVGGIAISKGVFYQAMLKI